MKIGIIMDSIAHINIKKDSSFAMLLECQKRKYEIFYMELHDIYLSNAISKAKTKKIKIHNNHKKWFEFYEEKDITLDSLNVILMRKNPPVDTEFIYATHILEYAEKKGTLIINKPESLRNYNEKIISSIFPNFIANTLITNNKQSIINFWKKYGDIILKPLNGMGGRSVFRIRKKDYNISVIIDYLTKYETKYCLIQEFLKDIKNGDKRILIINGKPIPYCLTRFPKLGEIRSNLAVGGTGKVHLLSDYDLYMANKIGNFLKSKGIIFAGLDIIGNKLTEINITSPTCIKEIESGSNISITKILMDTIENICSKPTF